jgi:hypothetical protein
MDREIMNAGKVLQQQILELLRGGNAYMEFDEIVDDFPLDSINDKAPNVPYSFWQILEHMRIAQWDILEFIRNPDHVSPHYPEGYRPNPADKADRNRWLKTIADFKADRQALEKIVADPHTDLLAPIPHAAGYTIFREILTVADHNSYHLGELAMIRQVLDLWPDGRKYLTGAPE